MCYCLSAVEFLDISQSKQGRWVGGFTGKTSKGKMSKGKTSKKKHQKKKVERKNIENAKMSLLTSIDVCSYYFSRIFFRLLLKSFRRLADTCLPIDLYERKSIVGQFIITHWEEKIIFILMMNI